MNGGNFNSKWKGHYLHIYHKLISKNHYDFSYDIPSSKPFYISHRIHLTQNLPLLDQIRLTSIFPRKEEIQLLERKLRRFRVEEPDGKRDGDVENGEDDVEAVVNVVDCNWGDFDHCSTESAEMLSEGG